MSDGAAPARDPGAPRDRLVAVSLDAATLGGVAADIAREREVAIRDLIELNHFVPHGRPGAAWRLAVARVDHRLVLDIVAADGAAASAEPLRVSLALSHLRRLIRDYYFACDSYFAALRTAPAETIAAIDVARKGLHDTGATLMRDRLAATVAIDFDTARRLFTLIATLFWKG